MNAHSRNLALGFTVTVYVNVTTVADALAAGDPAVADLAGGGRLDSPAIFCRRRPATARAGDRLWATAVLRLHSPSARAAAEAAFAAGNGVGPDAADYLTQISTGTPVEAMRSVSVGDLLVVETADGPAAFLVDAWGFSDADLAGFVIVGGRR